MRLIDADYLKNLPFERLIHTDYGETAISMEEIDNAPTIDTTFKEVVAYECGQKSVEERPKGKWELYQYQESRNKDWYCTACATIVKNPLEKKYIYCPYCGADMRGEEHD